MDDMDSVMGLEGLYQMHVLTEMNFYDVCNVVTKPGGKSADKTYDKGQHVSIIAQENLKSNAFLFHNRWR